MNLIWKLRVSQLTRWLSLTSFYKWEKCLIDIELVFQDHAFYSSDLAEVSACGFQCRLSYAAFCRQCHGRLISSFLTPSEASASISTKSTHQMKLWRQSVSAWYTWSFTVFPTPGGVPSTLLEIKIYLLNDWMTDCWFFFAEGLSSSPFIFSLPYTLFIFFQSYCLAIPFILTSPHIYTS